MRQLLCFCSAMAALFAVAGAGLAVEPASPVGRRIENFTLQDFRGREHSLAGFADDKPVVVVFLGTECPLAKLYAPRLVELAEKYEQQGVAFVGVNSNQQDSLTEIAAYARIHKIGFPLLKDLGNRVADQMGAVRTPEVFVLDQDRVARYWGRIDDQYGVGVIRNRTGRHYLTQSLDELLADKPVSVPETESVGCYIGRIRQPDTAAEVTYCDKIARIFQRRCVECHREGEIAPFALTDYDEVVGWAETIAEVVRDGRMPPWFADPAHGQFSNSLRMTDEEQELIYRWVRAGAPRGDPARLPEPRSYVTGWQLSREPDQVIHMREEPFDVPAEGEVRYQYFAVDPGFKEDRWVRMAELLPGNRAVVHHILVFVRSGLGSRTRDFGGNGQFLAAYVPGYRAPSYPDGMAKRIPAGSKLIFQVHYTPIGSAQRDRSKLGLVFAAAEDVDYAVTTQQALQRRFVIPPHADNHRVTSRSREADREALLLTLMPHMHLRGKSFRYEVRYPDDTREVLLDVPRYDFNWQMAYRLAQPKTLPAGSRIECVAHFDNSEDNLANPDPSASVRWGDQTWEEMMIGYFDVAWRVDPQSVVKHESDQGEDEQRAARLQLRVNGAISRFDKDGDGQLSREEIPDRLSGFFRVIDEDRDGLVTAEEMAKTFRRLP